MKWHVFHTVSTCMPPILTFQIYMFSATVIITDCSLHEQPSTKIEIN
jgi:hypothetical protein